MSEQLYVCDGAAKCPIVSDCTCGEPHELAGWCYECGRESEGGILGAKCVPVASQSAPSLYEALSTNSQPETERGTIDPDAAAAREYVKSATINNVEAGVYELDALLLRLADKVEGRKCQN